MIVLLSCSTGLSYYQGSAPLGAPESPSGLVVGPADDYRMKLAWARADNLDTSIVIERSSGGGYATVATLTGRENCAMDFGCDAGETYSYRVKAVNSSGSSGYSNVATASTLAEGSSGSGPAASAPITVNVQTPTSCTFNISLSAGYSYMTIDLAGPGFSFVPWAAENYLGGLTPGATYTARIRAGSPSIGFSAPTEITFTQPATSALPVPTKLWAKTKSQTQIDLTWTLPDPAAQVRVYCAAYFNTNNPSLTPFVLIATLPAGTTSYSHTGLTGTSLYSYRVSAWDGVNESDLSTYVDWRTTVPTATGVGGRTFTVGAGKTYAKISDIDRKTLGPGDVIELYDDIADIFAVTSRGAYDNPIIFRGMGSTRKTISLEGAVQSAADDMFLADSGVVSVIRRNAGESNGYVASGHIRFENLKFANGMFGEWTDSGANPRTGVSAGAYLLRFSDVEFYDCEFNDNKDGLFAKSYSSQGASGSGVRLRITNCKFSNNSEVNPAGAYSHHSYVECMGDEDGPGAIYSGNWYGPVRQGSPGAGIKDRSINTVIIGNLIHDTGTPIQCSESQDLISAAYGQACYHGALIMGNVIHQNTGDQPCPIWYGGDQYQQPVLRGGVCRLYFNTFVHRGPGTITTPLINDSNANGVYDLRGNAIYMQPISGSGHGLVLFRVSGYAPFATESSTVVASLKGNWITPGYGEVYNGIGDLLKSQADLDATGNAPQFTDEEAGDYRPLVGSPLRNAVAAASLPASLATYLPMVQFDYPPESTVTRAASGGNYDAGGLGYGVSANPLPVPVTPLTASFSFTPASGKATVSASFTATVSGGVPPYTYAWDFGDAGTSTLQNPSHDYTTLDIFTPTLTVTDSAATVVSAANTVGDFDATGYSAIILLSDPGYVETGGSWSDFGQWRNTNGGDGTTAATWTFSEATPDDYGLWVTQGVYHNYSSATPIEVYDGATKIATKVVNVAAGDATDPNLGGWVYVGSFTFAGVPSLKLAAGGRWTSARDARIKTVGSFVAGTPLPDYTAPLVTSATVNAAGTTVTFAFDRSVTNSTGMTVSLTGGAATLSYVSGSGTSSLVYNLSRTVHENETGTWSYSPGNITAGAPMEAATGAVTNNSTEPEPPPPTPIDRADNFNRADGYGETPSDGLGNYSFAGVTVTSNTGNCNGSAGYYVAAALETYSADVSVSAKLVTTWPTPCGLAVRVTNSSFVGLIAYDNLLYMCLMTQGTNTTGSTLASCGTYADGDTVQLIAIGTEVRAYKNGTHVGTATGVTQNQTTTTHGFFCGSFAGRNDIDDLVIDATSVAFPVAPLVTSATVNAAGTTVTFAFDRAVTNYTGMAVSLTGGPATLTYASGDGTSSLVYTLSRTVYDTETGTWEYTPGNITAEAGMSADDGSITNNSTQEAPLLTDNLISAWELNEASGGSADSHGSNTLTDNNTVGSATGLVYSNARDFEKDSQEWLSCDSNSDLQVGDIDFTIEAWVKLESDAEGYFVAKSANPDGEYFIYYDDVSNTFRWYVTTSGGSNAYVVASNFGTPSLGTWYQVVVTHEATADQISIAVNNGTANTTAHSGGVRAGTGGFAIGRLGANTWPGSYFDGLVGPVRFWKRLLTAGERTTLYNAGAGKTYASFTA